MSDVQNPISVEWFEHDDGMRVVVQGYFEAVVTETPTDDGIRFMSDAYKIGQKNLKDALGLAVRNGVNKAFLAEWSDRLPDREKSERMKIAEVRREHARIAEDNADKDRQIAELTAQIMAGTTVPKGKK